MLHEAGPSAEEIAKALGGKRYGSGFRCPCPAHNDRNPSLDVKEENGKVLFKCRANCTQDAVRSALKERGLWRSKANGRANGHSHTNGNGRQQPRTERPAKIVASYPYPDETGRPVFEVVRLEPKGFRQRRPDGTWSVQGVRQVPYHLPELIEAIAKEQPVYVTEGEKDADNLAKLNITATCNAGGAGKWKSEHAAFLKDADVVIIPDNDNPGRDHAEEVARSLQGIARRVRVLKLQGLPEKGDVSNWIEKGGTADQLWDLAEQTPEWQAKEGEGSADPVGQTPHTAPLEVYDGDDEQPIPPREWLLGTSFCRRFTSAIYAPGGGGKTALRIAQAVALASGEPITGEHVFVRCRVLVICLEDDIDELRRRIRACRVQHKIPDLKGWLFYCAPGLRSGKLMIEAPNGGRAVSALKEHIEAAILQHKIDVVTLDPLKKAHGLEENDNTGMDEVIQLITNMGVEHNVATDFAHHTSKGPTDAGNADRGRGASSVKDGARLVKTLAVMTPEEAKTFGISDRERRHLIRYDSGKENIAPPSETKWFRLIGVSLGNATKIYPNGDNVQTVEVWVPPDAWTGMSSQMCNKVLDAIDAGLPDGNRYTDDPKGDRAAWLVIVNIAPNKTEAEAKRIVRTWVDNGVLVKLKYKNPATRQAVSGLEVNPIKRPS